MDSEQVPPTRVTWACWRQDASVKIPISSTVMMRSTNAVQQIFAGSTPVMYRKEGRLEEGAWVDLGFAHLVK